MLAEFKTFSSELASLNTNTEMKKIAIFRLN